MRLWALRRSLACSLAVASAACHDERPTVTGPDTVAPRLQIVFPVGSDPNYPATFDRDSNGLMDLELRWGDSLGRVNTASLRIIARGGVPGASVDSNLAMGWRRVRQDSAGAAFEETVPLLLRSGLTTLLVSVADTAGNIVTESVTVALPPASFHRVINLNHDPTWPQERAANFVLLPDGSKGAVPFAGGHVAIFDPDGVFPTRYIHGVPNLLLATSIGLDATTGFAYMGGGGGLTPGISVVDLQSEQFVRSVGVGSGVVSVFLRGSRVYVGEACSTGRIIVLDKATLTEVGRIEPNYPPASICNNSVVRTFNSTATIGWARTVDRGALAFDAQTLAILQHLDVRPPPGDSDFGNVRDIRLLEDRYLYLARLEEGLDEIDLASGSTIHYSSAGNPPILELAVSPDGHQLFASALASATGPAARAPRLFSIPGLQLQWAFPVRPGRIGDAAVWHPDGKRVYVMAEFDVDVYLVRPR